MFSVFRNNLGGMPAGTFAAAVVTAGEPLVGNVNETKTQANIPGGEAKAAYGAFPSTSATDTVVAPLVKELFNGKTTGVAVVNAGYDPTSPATYVDAAGTVRSFETTNTVAPDTAVSFFFVYQNQGGVSRFVEFWRTRGGHQRGNLQIQQWRAVHCTCPGTDIEMTSSWTSRITKDSTSSGSPVLTVATDRAPRSASAAANEPGVTPSIVVSIRRGNSV